MDSYTDWSRLVVFGVMILVIAAFLLTAGILFQAFMDGSGMTAEGRLVNTSYAIDNWTVNIVDSGSATFDGNGTLTVGVRNNDTNDTYDAVMANCEAAYDGAAESYPEYRDRSNPCPELNQAIRFPFGLAP